MQLPPDEIMRQMSKLAMEQATEFFAQMADRFAIEMESKPVSGPEALRTFAKAIRATNAKRFPTGKRQ